MACGNPGLTLIPPGLDGAGGAGVFVVEHWQTSYQYCDSNHVLIFITAGMLNSGLEKLIAFAISDAVRPGSAGGSTVQKVLSSKFKPPISAPRIAAASEKPATVRAAATAVPVRVTLFSKPGLAVLAPPPQSAVIASLRCAAV